MRAVDASRGTTQHWYVGGKGGTPMSTMTCVVLARATLLHLAIVTVDVTLSHHHHRMQKKERGA